MAASVVSIWLIRVPPQLLLQVCMQHDSNLAAVGFSTHAVQQRSCIGAQTLGSAWPTCCVVMASPQDEHA